MKRPEPNWNAWVEKARHDFRAIDAICAMPRGEEPPWDVACFHAQQAAEKMLKAFLTYHSTPPPKVHDLAALLGLCRRLDATVETLADDCDLLTDFAVESRYPNDLDEPGEKDTIMALAAAIRIRDAVLKRLPVPSSPS